MCKQKKYRARGFVEHEPNEEDEAMHAKPKDKVLNSTFARVKPNVVDDVWREIHRSEDERRRRRKKMESDAI